MLRCRKKKDMGLNKNGSQVVLRNPAFSSALLLCQRENSSFIPFTKDRKGQKCRTWPHTRGHVRPRAHTHDKSIMTLKIASHSSALFKVGSFTAKISLDYTVTFKWLWQNFLIQKPAQGDPLNKSQCKTLTYHIKCITKLLFFFHPAASTTTKWEYDFLFPPFNSVRTSKLKQFYVFSIFFH